MDQKVISAKAKSRARMSGECLLSLEWPLKWRCYSAIWVPVAESVSLPTAYVITDHPTACTPHHCHQVARLLWHAGWHAGCQSSHMLLPRFPSTAMNGLRPLPRQSHCNLKQVTSSLKMAPRLWKGLIAAKLACQWWGLNERMHINLGSEHCRPHNKSPAKVRFFLPQTFFQLTSEWPTISSFDRSLSSKAKTMLYYSSLSHWFVFIVTCYAVSGLM